MKFAFLLTCNVFTVLCGLCMIIGSYFYSDEDYPRPAMRMAELVVGMVCFFLGIFLAILTVTGINP